MSITQDLNSLALTLSNVAEMIMDSKFSKPLNELEAAAKEFGKAWSKSWLGYQSNVYYLNFITPPPGARFSQEWGFKELYAIEGTIGDWQEYQPSDVVDAIEITARQPDISIQEVESKKAADIFDDAKSKILSALSIAIASSPNDKYLVDLQAKVDKIKILNAADVVIALRPTGQFLTRDIPATEGGTSYTSTYFCNGKSICTPFSISCLFRTLKARTSYWCTYPKSTEA